jgi:hypothetical protein
MPGSRASGNLGVARKESRVKRVGILACIGGLAALALGCEPQQGSRDKLRAALGVKTKASPQPTDAPADGSSQEEIEVFEGVVELFGRRLRARREMRLTEDGDYIKHGLAVAWYESGQKAGEMWFRDGAPEGPQRVWHENGRKKAVGEWKAGVAVGRWSEWHDNGVLASDGTMVDGERHGAWVFWGTDGRKRETVEFVRGRQVAAKRAATPRR